MKDTVFSTLAKYDSYFYTATSADFIRGLTKNEIKELTEAAKEVGIIYNHNGCPKCCLEFIKKLAIPYYKEKEEREKKVKEEAEKVKKESQQNKPTKQKKGNNYERQSQEDEGRGESTTNEVGSPS